MSLQDRVAIVTGGSRGIGAGIAQELGKRGAKVLITYAASSAKAEEVVKAIKLVSDAVAIQADCMDPASPDKVVAAATKAFGDRIDIIVNNAGAGDELFLEHITLEHFDKVFYTNVRFPMCLVKSCLPHLQKGGRIVNLSSVVARQGKEIARGSPCSCPRLTYSVTQAGPCSVHMELRRHAWRASHALGPLSLVINMASLLMLSIQGLWLQICGSKSLHQP